MKEFETGCLLIHGLAGSRREIVSHTAKLHACGFPTAVPLLAGHEAGPRELAAAKHTDWLQSVWTAYDDLAASCRQVGVIGFSMGGLLGIHLCQARQVQALVLINTPIYFWNSQRILLNLSGDFPFYARKYLSSGAKMPLPALIQFLTLLNKTKPLLANVRCTALIMQTLDDDTTKPASAGYLQANLGGPKTLSTYPTGGHIVWQTETGEKMGRELCAFLQELTSRGSLD
jgi:carboxylesterase